MWKFNYLFRYYYESKQINDEKNGVNEWKVWLATLEEKLTISMDPWHQN